ncbi:MAG TPA: sulfatase-like hydrolase/transferase, partial [Candidatus Hydrogenedentes bacterium]|nr:sulfatase-like hydrolase/transferase [Candidatus Hydrogenedentota bacterium]
MPTVFTRSIHTSGITKAVCSVAVLFSVLLAGCSPSAPRETLPPQESPTNPEIPAHSPGQSDIKPADRPNIIWIILDACRPDFSSYGYERPTSPTIDALAAEGALFESHYTQGLWTKLS